MDFQLPVGPNETVPLRITEKQRKLIVDKVTLPNEMANRLRFGVHEDNLLVFDFTLDELDELAEHIVAAVNRTKQKGLRKELLDLYDHVFHVLDGYTDLSAVGEEDEQGDDEADDEEWEGSPLDLLPAPIADELERLMEEGKIRTPKQLERTLHELAVEYNKQPLDELQGLSTEQVINLVECDWFDPESPIHLDTNIPLAELQGAEILLNARTFMKAVEEAGRVKLTSAGSLNRKFVSAMLDALILRPGQAEETRSLYKAINEDNVEMLGRIRWLLESMKLARHVKGFFQLTKKGRSLLDDGAASFLMSGLFAAHMRVMNLGFHDYLPECPELEETMGFTLYCLNKHLHDWTPLGKLAPKIFIPAVAARMEMAEYAFDEPLAECAECRIVGPLALFGLLEYRMKKGKYVEHVDAVRKTPLFDRFLHFGAV